MKGEERKDGKRIGDETRGGDSRGEERWEERMVQKKEREKKKRRETSKTRYAKFLKWISSS